MARPEQPRRAEALRTGEEMREEKELKKVIRTAGQSEALPIVPPLISPVRCCRCGRFVARESANLYTCILTVVALCGECEAILSRIGHITQGIFWGEYTKEDRQAGE